MSSYSEASDFIKRQAKLHEGFVTAAAMLDRIGSVELAAEEAQRARATAEAGKAKAELEWATIQAQINDAKDAAAQILLDAGDAAKAKAADVVMQANQTAQSILAREKANADMVAEASNAERLKALEELGLIKTEFAAYEISVADRKAAVDAAQKEHDRLIKAIDVLKSKFA